MRIDATGWLDAARRCPSPNRNARPAGCTPELIVVHGISLPAGRFGGPHIDALFANCLDCSADPSFAELRELRVSAHALIRRGGEIVQYVPFAERAWHAGVSRWRGRDNCNDFSIGIELEGCDEVAYEDIQYRHLARLVDALLAAYPALNERAIAGHCDIAPGRKTDPGPAFDWTRLHALLGDGRDGR